MKLALNRPLLWLSLLGLALGATTCLASDGPIVCATCHTSESVEFTRSIHVSTLSCQDCHGGAESFALSTVALEKYRQAAAAKDTSLLFDHGVGYTGKASRAEIPNTCGVCHANVIRMNPYGLGTDQFARYLTSGHGLALTEKGDDRVAVCTDCHGIHEVLPATEPASRTHLIALAPLQHTLNNEKVAAKVAELNAVCKEVNDELDDKQAGLDLRFAALTPIWIFSLVFGAVCYAKYKQLKIIHVKPLPSPGSRRSQS